MTSGSLSTASRKRTKASKKSAKTPSADFLPYRYRGSSQWSKEVRGKTHYFGTDPKAAQMEWDRVEDGLPVVVLPTARFNLLRSQRPSCPLGSTLGAPVAPTEAATGYSARVAGFIDRDALWIRQGIETDCLVKVLHAS